MAPVYWSNLPPDILSKIAKILNADVEILRLRAVCTTWRSSVCARLRPSSFPLKVPPYDPDFDFFKEAAYLLNYATIYRLSPPEHGPQAGDPSDGWLLRVLEVNPNRFRILGLLVPNKPDFPPRTIPKYLNLVDYRITEICKCYGLSIMYSSGYESDLQCLLRKIIVLNELDCDFVVLILFNDRTLSYWKFGDESWTRIDTKGYDISDMVICEGKCYAIGRQGVLVSFDSELNLTVVGLPPLPVICCKCVNYLVEYKSDLYVVSKIFEGTDGDEDDGSEFPFQLKVFKKGNNGWKRIRCLGDVMFFSSNDVSVGLSAEDFRGKGNCVYEANVDYLNPSFLLFKGQENFGVYRLGGFRTSFTKLSQDQISYWPPPAWLMKIAKDNYISGSRLITAPDWLFGIF